MKILMILALILNLTGYGDVEEQGIDTTLTEAVTNPMTGEQLMKLEGSLLADGPLTVTITRSQAGITDEFCCAGQCTAGNKAEEETLSYTPNDIATWFIHYTPAPNSDTQITYLFSDNTDAIELRVRYLYSSEEVEHIIHNTSNIKKILQSGQVQILRADKRITLQGIQISK